MAKRRAMTSENASLKKIAGHIHEDDFAELIGGAVNKGEQTNKKDVIDEKHRTYSVKGGKWWQVFLYGRARFESNTAFRGLGDLSPAIIACIDAFPINRADYMHDKQAAKIKLQEPMRLLCQELNKPNMLPAFFDKAFFNSGEVNYLSVLPAELANARLDQKIFHVFSQSEVVNALTENIEVTNSRARTALQMDAQKVIFRTTKNLGEIEIRTDSENHYRQAKCRVNGTMILSLLQECLGEGVEITPQVFAYGAAVRSIR